jgi:hypothetical protein
MIRSSRFAKDCREDFLAYDNKEIRAGNGKIEIDFRF